ncbi:hypothetical protein HgNV_011 [Homarus gammarus nudivirus]|uniref:Uncharacterized protein n=1 Tax=Homarus gammarus nudivirus TaxID=2509616 RepID=A0A411HB51_9VIRU|nr:hypothetical protein KM727_gp11 [Homarus gammarus nudivirus]QBB28616.1 hypothetical protein HgNV_011 [Homarus gammarus nudivirus]
MSCEKRTISELDMEEVNEPTMKKLNTNDEDDDNQSLASIYERCRNESHTSSSASIGTIVNSEDDYITKDEFKRGRLNIINSPEPIQIKATIESFNNTISELIGPNKVLSEHMKDLDQKNTYVLVYSLLVSHFTNILESNTETLKLILFALEGFNKFKDHFLESDFANRISGISQSQSSNINTTLLKMKTNKLIQALIGINNEVKDDDATIRNTGPNYHFIGYDKIYEIVTSVLSLCNKITRIATVDNMTFKQISQTTVESRDSNNTPIKKQAHKIQMNQPVLVQVSTVQISDGVAMYNLKEAEKIIAKLEHAMFFSRDQEPTKRVGVRWYQNVSVGELKKTFTLKVYEQKNKAIQSTTNKKEIPEETYILTDSFQVIYNENGNRFGLSVKCWPSKISQKDQYGNQVTVHFLDFTKNEDA